MQGKKKSQEKEGVKADLSGKWMEGEFFERAGTVWVRGMSRNRQKTVSGGGAA